MSLYKTVLVTDASAGFGYAIAELLAKNGYKVVACARRAEKLKALASQSSNIYPFELDVTDEKSVADILSRLPSDLQKIDVLVNNAGLALGQDKAFECKVDEWKTMVDTNINGLLYMTHELFSFLRW